MNRFFRDNSKKIMAVMSAFLMIIFFMPSFSGSRGSSDRGERVVATMFGGSVKITALQREQGRAEWGMASRLTFMPPNSQEPHRLAEILGRSTITQIETNPVLFLMLTQEAREQGIAVSNDDFQEWLRTVLNMPGEYDSDYDLARQSLYDLLVVQDLLSRVGDAVKVSDARAQMFVAISQQDVSLDVAAIPLVSSGPVIQPSAQQIQSQYDRFSQMLPGQFSDTNPLGFGYRLPNRVKLQYLGFTHQEMRDTVIKSHPAIEWDTKARRLYRTHPADFMPSTQLSATIAWENLPPEIVAKVYEQVYSTATTELAHKIQDRLNEQWSADWQAYHDAAANGTPSAGSSFATDDYLRKLASTLGDEFGVRPVLGLINNGWKTASDLKALEGIGPAQAPSGLPFVVYATVAGQQFTEAQQIPASQRLDLWQPSQSVYDGQAGAAADGFFIFSLTAMDPSHPAPLQDVRSQVIDDVRTQTQWDVASAAAAKLLSAARVSGLLAAAGHLAPPPSITLTDYFNPAQATEELKIPDLVLKPESARAVAKAAIQILTGSGDQGPHKVAQVALGPDREVGVIELHNVKPRWLSRADLLERQSKLAADDESQAARALMDNWTMYANAVDRTKYKEEPKGGE